jgi:hypothetical protein
MTQSTVLPWDACEVTHMPWSRWTGFPPWSALLRIYLQPEELPIRYAQCTSINFRKDFFCRIAEDLDRDRSSLYEVPSSDRAVGVPIIVECQALRFVLDRNRSAKQALRACYRFVVGGTRFCCRLQYARTVRSPPASRVESKLWRLLGRGITGEQRKRLEYLLTVPGSPTGFLIRRC